MTGVVWLNVRLVVLAFLAIVGIPLWMMFKRPDRHPDYAEARRISGPRKRRGRISAEAARRSAPGLAAARQHATAEAAIPGRRHSGSGQGRRPHRPSVPPAPPDPARARSAVQGRLSTRHRLDLSRPGVRDEQGAAADRELPGLHAGRDVAEQGRVTGQRLAHADHREVGRGPRLGLPAGVGDHDA